MSTIVAEPAKQKSSLELEALRAIDYDWTMHLQSVWCDPPFDSSELHTRLRQEFQNRLDKLNKERLPQSPLGWLVVGTAGTGKTHWLSVCRQQAVARDIFFVLVDMTDVRSFWDTVLQGYLDSLQHEYIAGKFQQQVLIERFLKTVGLRQSVETALRKLRDYPREQLAHNIDIILGAIRTKYPQSIRHLDVIRALLAMVSHDPGVAAGGFSWLSANPVDEECRKLLGFSRAHEEPREIIRALSWMMSLCSPTVLAFDQLDPIVAQLEPAAQAEGQDADVEGRALSIIQEIANGLGAMRDATNWTLTIVSCLEATLNLLRKRTLATWSDRFVEPAKTLETIQTGSAAESIIYPRVKVACESVGFKMPTPSWPLSQEALAEIDGQTPRELLKICELHRQQCDLEDRFTPLTSLAARERNSLPTPKADPTFDHDFARHRQQANVEWLWEQSTEDDRIAPLLIAGCRALLRETTLPTNMDAVVDDFPGGKTTKPLHARIRLIDHASNDREEHFCFRALERKNAIAFQARLKGTMNGSGLDKNLPFRHAVILRRQPQPGGEITEQLVKRYNDSGGEWYKPSDDEIRTLFALKQMMAANQSGFDVWLRTKRPATNLSLFKEHCKQLATQEDDTVTENPPQNEKRPGRTQTERKDPTSDTNETGSTSITTKGRKPKAASKESRKEQSNSPIDSVAQIPLGQRMLGSKSETVFLPLQLLERHTVVLAGAGSGKTVLIKRLVEEAAIASVPSIVIDCANDLSALTERWPVAPNGWLAEDNKQADQYFKQSEVVVWTPGRESGNPLSLEPLPDLSAVADNDEELEAAVEMASAALAPIVASGASQTARYKKGILSEALKFFARQGAGSLTDFIAVLGELPSEAGTGVNNQVRYAREMADCLRSERATNSLLRSSGTGLDPALLFGDTAKSNGKTRVSVISFIGLQSLESQRQFLNQLAMTLFSWIKKHPSPVNRQLRGLLVIDEAKDFVPSQVNTACKESLMRLVAQARKYHLGLDFATQNPREIDNRIVGNCSTHYYGKASSPAAIEVIKDQIRLRNGSGDDIPTLQKGRFYVYNADAGMSAPTKIQVPMCLSHHRRNPLDEDEILRLAAKCRDLND
jgi:hypothetical protein